MERGVWPQAKGMGTRVCMLMHNYGIIFIQVQGLVVVMMMAIALRMERHVVKLGGPSGGSRGHKQCSRLPDKSQHQHECTNRESHGTSLTYHHLSIWEITCWSFAKLRIRGWALFYIRPFQGTSLRSTSRMSRSNKYATTPCMGHLAQLAYRDTQRDNAAQPQNQRKRVLAAGFAESCHPALAWRPQPGLCWTPLPCIPNRIGAPMPESCRLSRQPPWPRSAMPGTATTWTA